MSDYTSQYYNQCLADSPPKKPSIGFFVAALLFIGLGAVIFWTRKDVGMDLVAEADLTVVQGKPQLIAVKVRKLRRFQRIKSLTYSVGGVKGYISQYHPKYDEVYAAVQRGRPLKMWIDGEQNVYQLQDRQGIILSYDDTAKETGKTEHAGLMVGIGLAICGLVMAGVGCFYFYQYGAYINAANATQHAA